MCEQAITISCVHSRRMAFIYLDLSQGLHFIFLNCPVEGYNEALVDVK